MRMDRFSMEEGFGSMSKCTFAISDSAIDVSRTHYINSHGGKFNGL